MSRDKGTYYLIEASVLPPVYMKVIEVKELLAKGGARTINEAAEKVGISRSAFYKYKDFVFPFFEKTKDKVITLTAILRNETGALSRMLSFFATNGCNILTINQSIPSNGVAPVSISFETGKMNISIDEMLKMLRAVTGVLEASVVGSE
ncbi:MAG: ACT domain-containing protein [Bacillota bacterium]|nr:ACT domain-containing protein [Bacillota bacterium]